MTTHINLEKLVEVLCPVYEKGIDLRDCLGRYNYFPRFTDYMFGEFAETIWRRGYLVGRELVLIYVWKNFWQENLLGVRLAKSEEEIRKTTRRIFEIDHYNPESINDLMRQLASLFPASGNLPLKLSSTILTVVHPDKYGIFDTRVRKTLQIDREDVDSCVTAVLRMREIAKEQETTSGHPWTTRMVDMALWSLDKYGK